MASRNVKSVILIVSLAALVGLLAAPALLAEKDPAAGKPTAAGNPTPKQCKAGCQENVPRLTGALKAIDAATEAVKAGKTDAAVAQLDKAQGLVGAARTSLAGTPYVNVRCPIMRSPIDPGKVTAKLTRTFQGGRVAFCCAGCPGKWDELTAAEKDARLAKVLPAGGKACGAGCDKPCCADAGKASRTGKAGGGCGLR